MHRPGCSRPEFWYLSRVVEIEQYWWEKLEQYPNLRETVHPLATRAWPDTRTAWPLESLVLLNQVRMRRSYGRFSSLSPDCAQAWALSTHSAIARSVKNVSGGTRF